MSNGAYPTSTQHQTYTAMPQINTPMVDLETGDPTIPWYRLFTNWFTLLGGGAFSSINQILTSSSAGAPRQPLIVGASPFVFKATASTGQLIVVPQSMTNGRVEFSRDGVVWDLCLLTGGMVRLMLGDSVRVSWLGAANPKVVFYPDAAPV